MFDAPDLPRLAKMSILHYAKTPWRERRKKSDSLLSAPMMPGAADMPNILVISRLYQICF
jgi:hypothetical protein